MNKNIMIDKVIESFCELKKAFGILTTPVVQSTDWWSTDVYLLLQRHAIQLHIDWRDQCIAIYLVNMTDESIPDTGGSYAVESFNDRCRKRIEDIYPSKIHHKKLRARFFQTDEAMLEQFLLDLNVYKRRILSNPGLLLDYVTGDSKTD